MSSGQLFDVDDHPLFDQFGTPIVCADTVSPETEVDCCDLCMGLIECLKRINIKFETKGVFVKDWLNVVQGTAYASNRHESTLGIYDPSGDDADLIFDGTWLMVPANDGIYPGVGGGFPGSPTMRTAWDADYPQVQPFAVWQSDGYRQMNFSSLTKYFTDGEADFLDVPGRMYLLAAARCYDSGGSPVLRFDVFLSFIAEGGNENCDPPVAWPYHWIWKIFEGDEIPVTDLTLADLTDVDVFSFDSQIFADNLWYDDDFVCECTAGPGVDASLCSEDHVACLDDYPCCRWCWWDDADDKLAAPLPIAAGNLWGDNTITLLRTNCGPPSNCSRCPPLDPPEPGTALEAVEISFTHDTNCFMNFAAVVPDCLDVVEYFWSFGRTGATSYHPLVGLDGTTPTEDVTLTVLDSRGCIYRYTETVTCGCECSDFDFGGSVTIIDTEYPGGTCLLSGLPKPRVQWQFTATDGGTSCPSAFLELRITGLVAACVYDDNCCPHVADYPNPGDPSENCANDADCARTLNQGQTFDFWTDADSVYCLRWRNWDGVCGCAGPWHYETICFVCDDADSCDGTADCWG